MEDSNRRGGDPEGAGDGTPRAASAPAVRVDAGSRERIDEDRALAPSEAFQTLADETRVTVLVELLAAERAGATPRSFSELQRAVDAESSAGFAYHLRQLTGHFVRKGEAGYVLTTAGRRAAEAIVAGTFTGDGGGSRAS
jgi:DNA-binding transcriptional ArsR family regulator